MNLLPSNKRHKQKLELNQTMGHHAADQNTQQTNKSSLKTDRKSLMTQLQHQTLAASKAGTKRNKQ